MKYFLSIVLLLFGCSERITVRVDYDKALPVSAYRSFNWLSVKEIESQNDPLIFNEMNDKRIRLAVNAQMTNAGYVLAPQNSELLLHYHIVVEEKKTINPSAYGYTYSPYWIDRGTVAYYYREGTLIIDVMDAANKQLLWRGWAFAVLGDDRYLSEQMLDEAIVKMFKKFPSLPQEERF